MARYDRDDILARIDLPALADQLVGGRRGQGRSAKWPSPVPGHPQTGATPPMSIFVTRTGQQRWTCFSTGESGTAIDLVMVTQALRVGDAIEWLADHPQATPSETHERRPAPVSRPPPATTKPSPQLTKYIDQCARLLWDKDAGQPGRHFLARRALPDEILQRWKIGYDPGPAKLSRTRGLPRLGPAIVFPAYDKHGEITYLQARYLAPDAPRKYDNPASGLATNPRLGCYRPINGGNPRSPIIITEGIPDALTATTAGYRAIAILGAATAVNATTVAKLTQIAGDRKLRIAFDNDPAGQAAAQGLESQLRSASRPADERCAEIDRVAVPGEYKDLNAWRAGDRSGFVATLRRTAHAEVNNLSHQRPNASIGSTQTPHLVI